MRPLAGLVLGTCVIGMACGRAAQAPTSPSPATVSGAAVLPGVTKAADSGEPVAFDTSAALGQPAGGRASGHVEVQGKVANNIRFEKYSFTASPDGEAPRAKGQVEVHMSLFTGEEIEVHAAVTCASVVGNEAWVGSRVVSFQNSLSGMDITDFRMIFRVQDNGDEAPAADKASLVYFGYPDSGLDLTQCNTRQQFPGLLATTTGNLQVKPE